MGETVTRSAALIGALLLALAVLLVAGQLGGKRPVAAWSPSAAPRTAVASQPTVRAPTPAPISECMDGARGLSWHAPLTFIDPLHGWAQGWACVSGTWQARLAVTSDGGQTWQPLRWPNAVSTPQEAHKLSFISPQDGWLLGPPATFATHDGGATWTEDHDLDGVVLLEAVGDSVWAARATCRAAAECEYDLLASSDDGTTWAPIPNQPLLHGGRILPPMPGYRLQILTISPGAVWLLSGGNEYPISIFATGDSGGRWRAIEVPACTQWSSTLAAITPSDLWLLCDGLPSAGSQFKWMYASVNGGAEWSLTGDSALLVDQGFHNLPIRGYTSGFVMVSANRGFLSQQRGGLLKTEDGGHTWLGVQLEPLGDGVLQLVFVDDQHGWATDRMSIWRTTDGGDTWERLAPYGG
jgi:photosystem II stability/assembly factor-like uncharacterized protein